MFSFIWHTAFFDPVYNGLIWLIDVVPKGDVGIAIIVLTICVKLILLPLSLRVAHTQRAQKELEPKLRELREKYKDNREELARRTLQTYREAGINPFAAPFIMLIQIPILIALYLSVYSGGGVRLPAINTDILYSFIPNPETVSMLFFGMVDVAAKNLPLALLAGVTQFLSGHLTIPSAPPKKEGEVASFSDDFARSMNVQMRYVMPVIIFFAAYSINAAIALYFTISNLFAIAQEFAFKPRHQSSNQN